MATSQRKIEANRANALKSTGPRTARGKRATSRNALAHGLTARAALLPGDDPREYRRFVLAVLEALDPRGPLEEDLAGEIANLSWKLRRVPGAEAILLEQKHGAGAEEPTEVIVNMILSTTWKSEPASPLWLLDRYTRQAERSRAAAMRMLLSLRKRRGATAEFEAEVEADLDAGGAEETIAPVQNKANGPAASAAPQAVAAKEDAERGDVRDEVADAAKQSQESGTEDDRMTR